MRGMAIGTTLFLLGHRRTQEHRFVETGTAGFFRKGHMSRRITIMTNQTEVGPAAGPRRLTAGVRIDQTHNTATMPARVMAQQAILVLDRAGDVLRSHIEFSTRAKDLSATILFGAGMTTGASIFPDIEVIVTDLPDMTDFTALLVFVMIINPQDRY